MLYIFPAIFFFNHSSIRNKKVKKTCTELFLRRDREAAREGPTTQTLGTETKQLRGVASGVRFLFLVGPHGKQTVLIKSPLLVRT